MTRVHVYVSGIVQGVCFRDFTQRRAGALGLAGWVRNLRDGRVEAVAQGSKEDIERWLADLRQGAASSRVDEVRMAWDETAEELAGFEIRF
jgi:acylphosphatase